MKEIQAFLHSLAEITSKRQYSALNSYNFFRVGDAESCIKRSINKIYRFQSLEDVTLIKVVDWKEELLREEYKPSGDYYWIDVQAEEVGVDPAIGVRQHLLALLENEIGSPIEVYYVNLDNHEGYSNCDCTEILFITDSGHYVLSFQAHD